VARVEGPPVVGAGGVEGGVVGVRDDTVRDRLVAGAGAAGRREGAGLAVGQDRVVAVLDRAAGVRGRAGQGRGVVDRAADRDRAAREQGRDRRRGLADHERLVLAGAGGGVVVAVARVEGPRVVGAGGVEGGVVGVRTTPFVTVLSPALVPPVVAKVPAWQSARTE